MKSPDDIPKDKDVFPSMEEFRSSSLMVNVDYLELVEYCGKEEAWVVLGKLKDLLG